MTDAAFEELKARYAAKGQRLYVVGGTARDLLLNRPYLDEDFATSATPDEEKAFLPEASYAFARFGTVSLRLLGRQVEITTLREEEGYADFRHPGNVRFVKDPRLDYVRRDFTINALYLDEAYRLLDYCHGREDLEAHLIRFIGDPDARIREDPLRLIRAERFASTLGFALESQTAAAIARNRPLLKHLNPEKIKEEARKGWKGSL